ncbi:DUF2232 domain-containing protein [Staphylococcus sp. H16/1A]|uniref:DUF2232 domain-containing protein n=1 Tax=Staphylococcus canis TaxID=2724942 RepID=A0ABS0T8A3_9STAP|nr:DUF2232 domain-containing protein [Staphylococcus canis]MBI5974980.1 DUF2232 domain-containing protein [Staphylococcus canis]
MFSQIKPKATILGTLALIVVVLAMYFVPVLGIVLTLFATLPGIILWHRSVQSFGIAALITIVVSTLTGNLYLMTFMIIVLVVSAIIGYLLQKRASKERILYISTLVTSILTLIAMMILQSMRQLPYAHELLTPYKNAVEQTTQIESLDAQTQEMLQTSIQQLAIQLPGLIVVMIAIFFIISLLIVFPILRKFKIATPVFRPLYFWQVKRSVFGIYALALLVGILTESGTTANSISLNFQIVLGLLMVIQGLSFIHYVSMLKRMPKAVSVIFIIVGIIFYPLTRLIGLLDLGLNLKRMIKNNKR